ncbi:10663_t:CDS:2 [Entrophospora sp. SA101]|nr:10663_t:CDS:2 [Entrophospora sp. SA101]
MNFMLNRVHASRTRFHTQNAFGLTLPRISIYLDYQIFAPGQASSRGIDNLCYILENNITPFNISLVWTFDDKLNEGLVKHEFQNLIKKFPRYSCILENENSIYLRWKYVPNFDVSENIEVHTLPTGTPTEFYECATKCVSVRLDNSRPLWRAYIINGLNFENKGEENENDKTTKKQRSALILISHHLIADGQGAMHAIMTLTSDGQKQLEETIQYFKERIKKSEKNVQEQVSTIIPGFTKINLIANKLPDFLFSSYLILLKVILFIWSFVIGIYEMTYAQIRMLNSYSKKKNFNLECDENHPTTLWWSNEIPFSEISIARKAYGVSFNDVMVAIVTRAVRSYLIELKQQEPLESEFVYFMPISMRTSTDFECNNVASGNIAFSPLSDNLSTKSLMEKVNLETSRIKRNWYPILMYLAFEYVIPAGLLNRTLLHNLTKCYHAVVTNVPGPIKPITFAGQQVKRFIGMPPQASPGGLAIGVISYDSKVSVSIMTHKVEKYPKDL